MGHPKETRPRKWHKPVPCPTCGSRNISFDRIGQAINRKTSAIRQIWACSCSHRYSSSRSQDAGYQRGGLSCDWSHVSGADKEPAR